MRMMDCFFEVLYKTLQYVEDFNQDRHHDFEDVRLELDRSIAENAIYQDGGFSEEQYHRSLFAVTAFIDEAFLLSDWGYKQEWKKESLQERHFNCIDAGEEFYSKLDSLSAFDPSEKDIREVYYYCLTLGFRGKFFRDRDQAYLDSLIKNNFNLLQKSDERFGELEKEKFYFPEAYVPGKEGTGIDVHIDYRPYVIGIPIIILLTMYFMLKLEIIDAANHLVTTL